MATPANTRRKPLTAERRFFTAMAGAVLLVTFLGFAPTYYLRFTLPPPHPLEPLTWLVHLHALVFTAWVLLFAAQTSLVAAGRIDLHRRLGMSGVALIALMIPLALAVAITGIDRTLNVPPGLDRYQWAAVPLLSIPFFAGLIIAALAKRRVPATHKRLMLIAMIDMTQPSIGRLVAILGGPGPVGQLLPLLLIVPLIVWDIRQRRRVHPATAIGGAIVATHFLIVPLVWTSAWWLATARWLAGLVA